MDNSNNSLTFLILVGIDTVSYSTFSEAITFQAKGFVNKGTARVDQIVDVETVIGAVGKANKIDVSNSASTTTSLNANLANNSLTFNGLPGWLSRHHGVKCCLRYILGASTEETSEPQPCAPTNE